MPFGHSFLSFINWENGFRLKQKQFNYAALPLLFNHHPSNYCVFHVRYLQWHHISILLPRPATRQFSYNVKLMMDLWRNVIHQQLIRKPFLSQNHSHWSGSNSCCKRILHKLASTRNMMLSQGNFKHKMSIFQILILCPLTCNGVKNTFFFLH